MLAAVVSAVTATTVSEAVAVPARDAEGTVMGAAVADGCTDGRVDDAVPLSAAVESFAVASGVAVAGFDGGNSN